VQRGKSKQKIALNLPDSGKNVWESLGKLKMKGEAA
jgi:hypothetical protein